MTLYCPSIHAFLYSSTEKLRDPNSAAARVQAGAGYNTINVRVRELTRPERMSIWDTKRTRQQSEREKKMKGGPPEKATKTADRSGTHRIPYHSSSITLRCPGEESAYLAFQIEIE